MKINNTKSRLYKTIVIAGFLSFLVNGNPLNPLMFIAAALIAIAAFGELKYKKRTASAPVCVQTRTGKVYEKPGKHASGHVDRNVGFFIRLRDLVSPAFAVLPRSGLHPAHVVGPLSSGLLCFPMRFFYWDKFDFLGRVHSLLLLALLFSAFLMIREFDLLKKFLTFFNKLSLKKRLLAIFIFTEILFIFSSAVIVKKGVVLSGDEPHYLALSQSIVKDADLNVFNQYFREGYKEFIAVKKLPAHAAFGRGYKRMYSIHLPGVSFTIAPFLLLKIPLPWLYFLIRSFLGIFGALLAVVVYLFSLRLWQKENLSLFISAVFILTTPVFFHSFHIFPELQALLLILSALYFLFFPGKKKHLKTLLAGLLLGVTVFWGLKYVIFIYLFSAGFFFYFFVKKKERRRALLFVLFPILLQMLFFYYLYFAYGNFSPMSVYTGMMNEAQAAEYYSKAAAIPFKNRVETLLNYFFDQRDGLLLYSPFYFFAFPGLLIALRKFKTYLPYLLVSLPGFIYILYHGYSTVRAGYCPQARYLVPVMWLFMLFAVIYLKKGTASPASKSTLPSGKNEVNKSFDQTFSKVWPPAGLPEAKRVGAPHPRRRRNFFYILPIYSLFVVIYQVLSPFTLYQPTTHDSLYRSGLMFLQWSNIHFNIPALLPSFVKVEGNFKYLPNIIFLVLFVFLIVLALLKNKNTHRRNAFSPVCIFIVIFLVFILFPKIPLYNTVLVQKEGAEPYRIYGESKRPGQAAEKIIEVPATGTHSYTVSTIKKAKHFVLEFFNKTGSEVEVSVYNFDSQTERAKLPPQQTRRVYIDGPRFKKFKNKFFYRFTLSFSSLSGGEKGTIDFQLYPQKKRAGRRDPVRTRRR